VLVISHCPLYIVPCITSLQTYQPPIANMASAKCNVCGKTAYAAEQVRPTDDIVFHKTCFKCEQCHTVLKLGNYAALDGKYFCKPHFKQLFALKGNYNEGFGTEKHSANWTKKDGEEDKKPEKEEKKESPVKSSAPETKKDEEDSGKKDKKDIVSSYEKKSNLTSSSTAKTEEKKVPLKASEKEAEKKSSPAPSKAASKYTESEKENATKNGNVGNVDTDLEQKKRGEKIENLENRVEKMLDQVALRKKKIQQLEKDLEKMYKSPNTSKSGSGDDLL